MNAPHGPAPQPGWQAAFKLLFETSATPVAILDEHRRVVDLNAAAQKMLGRARSATAGEPVGEAVAPSERERSEAEWNQLLRDGRLAGTRTLIRADCSEVRVEFSAVVEAVAGGCRAIFALTPAGGGDGAAPGGPSADLAISVLTTREAQVVRLIAAGLDTSDIAARLHVSPNTVRSHVRNAMSKFSARTRAQLVAQALGGAEAHPG
jgi:PAS domain S-box-containing protein